MKTKKASKDFSTEDSSLKQEKKCKESRSEILTRLYAQKALALQANNTKAAAQIQKVIDLIESKGRR